MTRSSANRGKTARAWMRRLAEERGATATEYGILLSFIVLLTMGAITLLGLELMGWFDELTTHLKLLLGIP
ncbi:Flp family type IVb pilin [Arthrobacter sp. R4]|uniref:Flp family type IVb pilin n=1 Tax=Arthrobacter sp. R4 TaxID=644417 RepID=UPI003EDAE9A0